MKAKRSYRICYYVQRALEERAKGHDYWVYNGGRPFGGAIVIDAPATDARATIWGCFKHGIKVYFYWHGDHWQHNRQKQGDGIFSDVQANSPVGFSESGNTYEAARYKLAGAIASAHKGRVKKLN